jgi:hypothetical protein
MNEIIDNHQTITIINIISLYNNTSQVITITTTVMIMTIKIKESHNNSYEDTKKYSISNKRKEICLLKRTI